MVQTPQDSSATSSTVLSDFDRYRQSLVTKDDDEGWASEKRRYLKEMPADVTKDTDVVEWWQVRASLPYIEYFFVTDLINRIMLSYIQPSPVLPSTSYHARHHPSPASASFRQLNKLLMIDDHVWDQRGLRSYS
jgi:hypothetical protein